MRHALRFLFSVSALGAIALAPTLASAQSPVAPVSNEARDEGARHFRRGVELFKETDFNGALAEFRRAQQVAPNPRVLYNIGQTYFEMQRYPDALKAFEDYLTGVGDDVPKDRRAQVSSDIEKLKQRVAKLDIKTDASGAQVRVDDEVIGTTPLTGPVVVSVGRHRVGATLEGHVAAQRTIEIVGGDVQVLNLELPLVPESKVASAPAGAFSSTPPPPEGPSHVPMWIGWTATGVLALSATTVGILQLGAKGDLKDALAARPGNPSDIDSSRSKAKTLAGVTDALGAAAIVAAGISTYLTVRAYSSSPTTATRAPSLSVDVAVSPTGAFATGRF